MDKPEKSDYPMRINKYLALRGYSTRRGADELIEKKKVFINDRLALLGDKVTEADDVVVKQTGKPKVYTYLAYNKPRGLATEEIAVPGGLFPIGRLDKMSEGLLILTDDGRITDRLLNPDRTHDKEYSVTTKEKLRSSFKQKMESGVDIEGYITKPCKIDITGEKSFKITLTEGKKHQIRRMCVALFNEVRDLKRNRILNIGLSKLSPGNTRKIEGEELEIFLKKLGL